LRAADTASLDLLDRSAQPPPQESPQDSRKRSASILSDPSTDHEIHSEGNVSDGPDLGVIDEGAKSGSENRSEVSDSEPVIVDPADHDEEVEDWEAELEEVVEGPKGHIRDWADLRTDIKKHLKKHSKTLPLSRLNQLMIISNFATLRLKGLSRTQASIEIARQWHEGQGNWFARRVRALARHYQIFEKLPVEKRGGSGNSRSWLHDESVKKLTLNWLTSQKTGDVTPRKLQHALNDKLFTELNITPKSPISERTARRWLIKLGWRQTVVRKGVYMAGHEREDVVDYWNKVFLPALKGFEKLVAKYERFDLDKEGKESEIRKIMPELEEGQRRIIIQYHDECCFHANDDARNLW
jgi:hypothetical protein